MSTEYSKPSGDVAPEAERFLEGDAAMLARQARLSEALAEGTHRGACVLCGSALGAARRFTHRGVPYARCGVCDHVQTSVCPPDGYPHRPQDEMSYDDIYPALDGGAYESRRERIYQPKLDWAFRQLREAGWSESKLLNARWLEFGAGAGYFVDTLRRRGVTRVLGLERDSRLVSRANQAIGADAVRHSEMPLVDAIGRHEADVLAAFFVLEHVDDPGAFWRRLAATTSGTVLIFSVPCYGLSAVLETAFGDHAARCLDSVVHTQLYTDASIAYALELAGMQAISAWHFGQDALDLRRLLLVRLRATCTDEALQQVDASLSAQIDRLQQAIDRAHLSDSRHIVAVRIHD